MKNPIKYIKVDWLMKNLHAIKSGAQKTHESNRAAAFFSITPISCVQGQASQSRWSSALRLGSLECSQCATLSTIDMSYDVWIAF